MRGVYGVPATLHNGGLSDVACQMIPWRAAVKRALELGQWPLWNPYLFGGGVLAASAQPAVYSPFTLLACLLPIGTGTTYLASIWFFVAALGAFLFARELGCHEAIALFAAAAWPFSVALATFILWPLGQSWTLLPLVLLAVRRINTSPGFASAMFLIVAFFLLIVAGHPETVLHVVLVGAFYGLMLIAANRTQVTRRILLALAAGIVAVLLTSIYLLPVAEALPQTREYIDRTAFAATRSGADGNEALARLSVDFFPWLQSRAWRPDLHVNGFPPVTAAVGSIVVALAAVGIWKARSAESWFFCGLLAIGIASGTNWRVVNNAWKKLPLFDISINDYLAFSGAFGFVVLATLALDRAYRQSEWRLLGLTVGWAAIVFSLAALAADRLHLVGPNLELFGDFRLFAELAAPALVSLLLLFSRPSTSTAGILLMVLLAQRTIEEGGVYPVLPADAAYPPIPILSPLRDVREPFRIVGHGLAFIPGTSTMYGLEDVRGYTAMTFEPITETWPLWCRPEPVWFNRVHDLDRPFLSFLNVRYAITWSREPDHDGWREVARQRGSKLLENTRVIERAFVPEKVALGRRDSFLEMAATSDFRKRAWINTEGPAEDRRNGAGAVVISRSAGGRLHLDAAMQQAGWIVVSEQCWRGWRVRIDGRRVKIHRANIAFLAIYVPAGKHRVDVIYWPESFVIGRTITAGTLLGLMMVVVWRRVSAVRVR